jgi:hypothetical protein
MTLLQLDFVTNGKISRYLNGTDSPRILEARNKKHRDRDIFKESPKVTMTLPYKTQILCLSLFIKYFVIHKLAAECTRITH